ncbi:hypothetical protein ACFV5G_18840 [Streptomyces sp. NPDC059766]|uniref:hypothetical protein n=1 Tax=Streptomyces sp. NPDC059766 TaxID=3346940 RepID=UPI00365F0A99
MEQLSAGKKLDSAFEKLSEKKAISFEFDLDTDAQSLKALDASSDPKPGEEMPDDVAEMFSGAKVSVTVQSKKPIAESGEKDYVGTALKISNKDGVLTEYRVVGDYTYIRSDVNALGKAMGFPAPSAKDLPPEANGLKKVLQGEWVKISTKEIQKSTAELGAAPGAKPAPEPTLDAKTQKQLLEALRGTIAREVDFKTVDGKDGAEHVIATAPFRTLISKLLGAIRPFAKDLPMGTELPTDKDLKDAPNAKVAADFTLKNGELTEVSVDLAKLAENAKVKKLGLVMRMIDGPTPTAPAGATELDVDELLGGFGAAMMGGDAFSGDAFPGDAFSVEGL